MEISKKLVYQYMSIFFHFTRTSNHLRPLQDENCDSNSRLVVDEDDNVRLERVNQFLMVLTGSFLLLYFYVAYIYR